MTSAQEKFQALLRELFQFDCADLDFGIYRVMNHKRRVIERFINEDLPRDISKELEEGTLAAQAEVHDALEAARQKVLEDLLEDALDADGNLAEKYRETRTGKKYLAAQARAKSAKGPEALEATIFNHLNTFFSRYYQDGDFISKRRYSKRERYAIPYNGEEVYLYWANHDQYYVKTAEHFHDYTFTSCGVTVHFKLTAANVEQNNVKGDKRFFLPRVKEIDWNEKADELIIPFEFRPLTDQEKVTYGTKNQQDKINAEALEAIPGRLSPKEHGEALAAITAERHKNSDGQSVSFLEHHLRQYTRKNTSDFFIHKDLKGFLSRELDFYLKNEVLNLDEMEAAGQERAEGWFQMMRVIKTVGSRIIDFLDQIEQFQKMLWEKRKFITETQYCITVGNIDERFYPDIAACEAQWDEWKELFNIDEEQRDLFTSGKSKEERRTEFLKAHPTLVLDTKHFAQVFVDSLTAYFRDIDVMTDGLLIHGENWQALNLIEERFHDAIDCAYVDPPYNTGNDGFLYKDTYKHSSWLSFMNCRLARLLSLAGNNASLFVSIDDNEAGNLVNLVHNHSPSAELVALVAAQLNPRGRTLDKYLAKTHEYIATFALFGGPEAILELEKGERAKKAYRYEDCNGRYRLLELRNRNPVFNRKNRPNLFYPFYADPETGTVSLNRDKKHSQEILPLNSQGEDGCWTWSKEKALRNLNTLVAKRVNTGAWRVYRKDRFLGVDGKAATTKAKSIWTEKTINNENGKELVRDLFGQHVFDFPKPTALIEKCASIGMRQGGWFIDYVAGSGTSGHALINLNRTDGAKRRWILVEMDEYFDTVLLPRLKKVIFAPEWKNGRPTRLATQEEAERSPRIVKYIRLESYEDALNNIAFDDVSGQGAMQFEDYLLKYMLKWETRKSETLLNVEKLTKPFSYKLYIHSDGQIREKAVDIPETFNYLLGLHVSTRKVYDDNRRRYLVYHGRIDHRRIAVIWRETEGWTKEDLERDKKFVAEQKLTEGADEVFVNGDSFIPNAKALEPVFKARMFAPVEA